MDSQPPSNQSLPSNRAQIFEEIRCLGYEHQNQQLFQMGFTRLLQNLKYLKKYQGDVQVIVTKFAEKQFARRGYKDPQDDSEVEGAIVESEDGNTNTEPPPNQLRDAHVERRKLKLRAMEFNPGYDLKDYLEWPPEIDRIYLDGNNMLYVEGPIRKLAITQRKREAEKLLADLVLQFTTHMGIFDLVLVFDNTNLIYTEKVVTAKRMINFTVLSATPNFNNADDALVCWSEGLGESLKRCLFVTSDRELQIRLIQKGAQHIMKTKRWFNFVKAFLGEAAYNSILSQRS